MSETISMIISIEKKIAKFAAKSENISNPWRSVLENPTMASSEKMVPKNFDDDS